MHSSPCKILAANISPGAIRYTSQATVPTDNKFQHSIKLWPSQDNTVASKAELDPSEPLKSMDLEWC